mgnify:CR=1 FL=1
METKPYELVDAFWKNWSQSLSLFSSAGKQLEQLTLETLKQQQDALHKLTSGVDELEKELQQLTAQFNIELFAFMNISKKIIYNTRDWNIIDIQLIPFNKKKEKVERTFKI